MPALFTRISIRPKRSATAATAAHGCRIAGVGLQRNRLATGGVDLGDDLGCLVRRGMVGDGDRGAVAGEALGDGGADRAAGAGDDRDLALE
jgi:hypothetical protein